MARIPVEEVTRPLLRPVVDGQLVVDEQLRSSCNSQAQLIIGRLVHRQAPVKLNSPSLSQALGQEVVELDTGVLENKFCNRVTGGVAVGIVVVEGTRPAGLS